MSLSFIECESKAQYGYSKGTTSWTSSVSMALTPLLGRMQKVRPMQSTYECPFRLDDSETRLRLWKFFFPDKPFEGVEDNAVEKYFGLFDKRIKKEHSKDVFDEILRET
jgi:hypothetical protein